MAWLTLATSTDRWENGSLREEGRLWVLVEPSHPRHDFALTAILKKEVADWCWANIGAYRIVEHAPSRKFGPDEDDSWRIEFKSDTDMAFFKMRWMGE